MARVRLGTRIEESTGTSERQTRRDKRRLAGVGRAVRTGRPSTGRAGGRA